MNVIPPPLLLEVCVDTVQAAVIASQAGAHRIELCSALETGGVTPSRALIQAVRQVVLGPLVVLIRCRSGDFVYDATDRRLMLKEIEDALADGADAVALGSLQPNLELDWVWLEEVRHRFPGKELVIHRAFDCVHDQVAGMERLIDLGYQRILTSGGPNHALDGMESLRTLIEISRNRIEILPAGGIQASNAIKIMQHTHCKQVHGSFRDSHSATDPFASRMPRADWIRELLSKAQVHQSMR